MSCPHCGSDNIETSGFGEDLTQVHEFSEGLIDSKVCNYCGGYPFDLQHWTI